jgi:hypothetical protein
MNVRRPGLSALARKYRTLANLRRESQPSPNGLLRALAAEFPGALRELDCLPLSELERRLAAVTQAEAGGAAEPWIEWMLAYHQRMRLALHAKRRLRSAGPGRPELLARVADELGRELGSQCDADFVARVAVPPRGRLNLLVFELLEAELGQSRLELERTLFPRLRTAD